jgi:hypothetical protein
MASASIVSTCRTRRASARPDLKSVASSPGFGRRQRIPATLGRLRALEPLISRRSDGYDFDWQANERKYLGKRLSWAQHSVMSNKFARREYLLAMAEFERNCAECSRRMDTIFEPLSPDDHQFLSPFGPRKPVKRATRQPASGALAVPKRRKAA